MTAILNWIELNFLGHVYPSLKPHILYHSNGLAIWHGFPDNKHIKDNNANGHKSLAQFIKDEAY